MFPTRSIPFASLVCLSALTACQPLVPPDPDLTQTEQALVVAANRFGFDLLGEVCAQEEAGRNVFISPLSVSMALGMTWIGARGDTATQMQTMLGYASLTADEVKAAYRHLIDVLTTLDPDVTLEIANSIWTRLGFPVGAAFLADNETYFDAQCSELDFSDAGAADTINSWVAQKTHERIDSIVEPPIRADTIMFLIDAIYFKGTWTTEFDPTNTGDAAFHAADGDVTVPLMNLHADDFRYGETEDAQVIDLPYGNERFSMTVMLPKPGTDADDLIEALTPETFAATVSTLVPQEGDLGLPRFEIEYEKSLNDVLKALGMQLAFGDSADLSGINPDADLVISNVRHKTYVKVNEEGTEAAAVTSVEVGVTSMPMTFRMTVDRPFVFVIHDVATDAILFAGRIVDPSAE